MQDLKDRLTELAEELKLPRGWQARLASHCRVKAPSVSAWLSGETRSLHGDTLLLAAEFFGVTPKWLQSGKGHKWARDAASQAAQASEPIAPYAVMRREGPGGKLAPDYRVIVHTLLESIERAGLDLTPRQFVEMADETFAKLSS
jgi:transcriptional regulator with XRE-family HTH domain